MLNKIYVEVFSRGNNMTVYINTEKFENKIQKQIL